MTVVTVPTAIYSSETTTSSSQSTVPTVTPSGYHEGTTELVPQSTLVKTYRPQYSSSTLLPEGTGTPPIILPETDILWRLLIILRNDLAYLQVNATVLHTLFTEVIHRGTADAYQILILVLNDLKRECQRLPTKERIKVAFEVAHLLKTYGARLPHSIVVQSVSLFLCAIDHADIITVLLSENIYILNVAENIVNELTPPDLVHLIHLLYADRNISAIEESPCSGILCEEVPESVMDTIDMLVDRYFPNSAAKKKWLMLDIAKALNLQPEEDEEGGEFVYYKLGDYNVILEELRVPVISDDEKHLLLNKFFTEVRKVAKAERKLDVDEVEEVWMMGEGHLPPVAVRSFISLLKLVHSRKITLEPRKRIKLLEVALRCDKHECEKLTSTDIHNFIFALCNVGIRDGFGLPKDVKEKVSRFILKLKEAYIDSISLRRWRRNAPALKPKAYDYLSQSSPDELRFLKDWLQTPINLNQDQFHSNGLSRSLENTDNLNRTLIYEMFKTYVHEKKPGLKSVLAEKLLDSYNQTMKTMGPGVKDTEKFIVTVLQQLPGTTARHNDLVLSILDQCIALGDPCLNVTRRNDVAPLKVILQNMSLQKSPNFAPSLAHKLEAASKMSDEHVDLSWLQTGPQNMDVVNRVPALPVRMQPNS